MEGLGENVLESHCFLFLSLVKVGKQKKTEQEGYLYFHFPHYGTQVLEAVLGKLLKSYLVSALSMEMMVSTLAPLPPP